MACLLWLMFHADARFYISQLVCSSNNIYMSTVGVWINEGYLGYRPAVCNAFQPADQRDSGFRYQWRTQDLQLKNVQLRLPKSFL